jgi:hypothetical protein
MTHIYGKYNSRVFLEVDSGDLLKHLLLLFQQVFGHHLSV